MSALLGELWADLVRAAPEARALIEAEGARVISRAALARDAHEWTRTWPAGARLRGQRVVMTAANGAGWMRQFIGLLDAGAVPAALDPSEPWEAALATARAIGAAWVCGNDGALHAVAAPRRRSGRDACLIKLTSGSTGAPRALEFTHAQMIADGRQVCSSMGIRADDVNLAAIPFGHSYGLGNLVVPLLAQGTAIVCASSALPHALAADAARWRPTVFPAVPALLRALTVADVEAASLASLRVVISAGAPLPAEVARAFVAKFGRAVHAFYGSTETGGICFDRVGEATLAARSVGTPLDGVTLHFRRGRRFEVESAAVVGRGRFSPRDFAARNALGELVLLGRAGRMVKISGHRLDLAEIESALRSIARVRDAFVIAHPERADALAAAVAGEVSVDELRHLLRARLAAWKIPERLLVLEEFPLTARGKTDTRELRKLLGGRVAQPAPRDSRR